MRVRQGCRLRELRVAKGLQAYEVAVVARRSESMISLYEREIVPIPDEVKARLAEFFGVSRAYLMGWDGDRHQAELAEQGAA